jgi:hypothetical protein
MLMSGCVYIYSQLTYTTENEGKMVTDITQKNLLLKVSLYDLFCSEDLTLSDTCVKFA